VVAVPPLPDPPGPPPGCGTELVPPCGTEPDPTGEPTPSDPPPATDPPATEPPATEPPPATDPPVTDPPATPPGTEPPGDLPGGPPTAPGSPDGRPGDGPRNVAQRPAPMVPTDGAGEMGAAPPSQLPVTGPPSAVRVATTTGVGLVLAGAALLVVAARRPGGGRHRRAWRVWR
jgi:hypothetical protein